MIDKKALINQTQDDKKIYWCEFKVHKKVYGEMY